MLLIVSILVFISISIISCTNNPDNKTQPEPYFPTQKEPAKTYMLSLLTGGTLVIDNDGYLRIGATSLKTNSPTDPLIIWPYGYSLKIEGKNTWVVNDKGQSVARVGDRLELGGGFVDASVVEVLIGHALPKTAKEPYYIAAPL